jgi:flagellar biogenesis protein FliO
MYAFLNKYGQALAFGIGVLVVAIFLGIILTAPSAELDALVSESAGPEKYDTGVFDFGIGISLFLTGLAFVIALVFGVMQFASDPKGSVKGLIGLAVLAVIVFIGYSTANGEITAETPEIKNAIEKFTTSQETTFTGGNLKFISGAILAALIMIALSIVTLIVFGVRSLFK